MGNSMESNMSLKCPECDNSDRFSVLRSVWDTVDGKGDFIEREDVKGWEIVVCPSCGYEGHPEDFSPSSY
jgi:uncharacterized protein (DUF2225 family)